MNIALAKLREKNEKLLKENFELKIENIKLNNNDVSPVRDTSTKPHEDQSGSKKSNVTPNGPRITSSLEFNNANIVTESILIDHPEARSKTKRASKKRRRKTITKKEKENTKMSIPNPQVANDETSESKDQVNTVNRSNPQVADDKDTDSSG